MSVSSSDAEMEDLFGERGESVEEDTVSAAPKKQIHKFSIDTQNRLPISPIDPSTVRVIKLPPKSTLSVESLTEETGGLCIRVDPETKRSNTRLVEWEDGSMSLVVGSEHFRIMKRDEEIFLFDKQNAYSVSVCGVPAQLNVMPGSLESRTHQRVVEKSAVTKKLNEARKVYLATGHHVPTTVGHSNVVTTTVAEEPALTADFLEEGVKAIKQQFKRGRAEPPQRRAPPKRRFDDEDDVEFDEEEPEDGESIDSDESESSDSDSSSSSSSSSDSS
jgi:hypothetical protein